MGFPGGSVVKNLPGKQKTAYEIRSGDWSSDVCSSDLPLEKFVCRSGSNS